MPTISRSTTVSYSAQQMFDLVADVNRYPEFLPWCTSASVTERPSDAGDEQVDASLTMSKGPLRKSFTTRNRHRNGERIDMRLLSGPFKRLRGSWRFSAVPDGSHVQLDLEFEMQSGLARRVLEPLFSEIAGAMVEAFRARAEALYGAALQ